MSTVQQFTQRTDGKGRRIWQLRNNLPEELMGRRMCQMRNNLPEELIGRRMWQLRNNLPEELIGRRMWQLRNNLPEELKKEGSRCGNGKINLTVYPKN